MAIVHNATCRFNVIPRKIYKGLWEEMHKLILTVIWKIKGLQNKQNNRENQRQKLILPNFKSSNKATVNKHCDTAIKIYTDQWDLIENPEIHPFIYGQLNFDKGGQHAIVETMVFSTNGARPLAITHTEERNWTLTLTPHTNINSKWIKSLNVRGKLMNSRRNKWRQIVMSIEFHNALRADTKVQAREKNR